MTTPDPNHGVQLLELAVAIETSAARLCSLAGQLTAYYVLDVEPPAYLVERANDLAAEISRALAAYAVDCRAAEPETRSLDDWRDGYNPDSSGVWSA